MKNTKSTLYILDLLYWLQDVKGQSTFSKKPAPDYYGGIEQNMVINDIPKDPLPWITFFLIDQRILPL